MLQHPGHIPISDYDYPLPADRIAQYPLDNRDDSRLLVYHKDRTISQDIFKNLDRHLPEGCHLYFNQTKVIPARLFFRKGSGALIEVFCLEPAGQIRDYQAALLEGPGCRWKCLIGNARRWKSGPVSAVAEGPGGSVVLEAERTASYPGYFEVTFRWTPGNLSFSEVLESFGRIPLPPYIRREAEDTDKIRYQTIFAKDRGSIAAPTAGLHFTSNVLDSLSDKGIASSLISLHVGAGTFKPVTSETIMGHDMHSEFISIPVKILADLISHPGRTRALVGTTTVRAMESAYWQGVKWMNQEEGSSELDIRQWDPYRYPASALPGPEEALKAVVHRLESDGKDSLTGYTSLMIAPGYPYQLTDILITNFHMPQSTLLLLVSAFIGDDWKKAYQFALDHQFRFLSYGDSCLFHRPF